MYHGTRFAPAALFAFLALIDLAVAHPAAPGWFPLRLGYAGLAVATHFAHLLWGKRKYRRLPPGHYGSPLSGSTPS